MPPENLPINEQNPQGDWWIWEKISQTKSYQDIKAKQPSFQSPETKSGWWSNLPLFVVILLAVAVLISVYQNRAVIASVFPNTTAVLQAVNIFPELFTETEFALESRYSLSALLISLDSKKSSDPIQTTTTTVTQETSLEKPIKIIINKIGVNATVINPVNKDIDTLNNALKLGAVRYPDSGFLDGDRNIFIFAHSTSLETNTTYYKIFNNLGKLAVGDQIILRSAKNEYTYKITSASLTNSEEGFITFDNDRELILSTCNTIGQKEERILVKATLVKISPLTTASTVTVTTVTPQAGISSNSVYEVVSTPTEVTTSAGRIDFIATIDSFGILDANGNFIASSTPSARDKVAVKFTVKNIGNKKSEDWYFNAVLPTNPAHIFHSKSQPALAPGEKIEFTMGFDKPKVGENQLVVINVDPTGGIKESNKDNNIAKSYITITE